MTNKDFIVAGIENLIKNNYDLDPSKFDIRARVDSSLSFRENWKQIKPEILRQTPKHVLYHNRRYA